MMKANGVFIEYRLNNGAVFQYCFSCSKDVNTTITEAVAKYVSVSNCIPQCMLLTPVLFSELAKQYYARDRFTAITEMPLSSTEGLRLWTQSGLVTIFPRPKLRWPIFIGTEEEYNNNDFDEAINKVLSE